MENLLHALYKFVLEKPALVNLIAESAELWQVMVRILTVQDSMDCGFLQRCLQLVRIVLENLEE